MINYARSAHHTLFHLGLSFVAGFAYFAVIVFFVLSGYLVGGSFYADILRERASVLRYYIKRVMRLWIVLVPSLVLTYILTRLDIAIFPAHGSGVPGSDTVAALSWATAVCNVAFLQYAACAPYGWSVPLWSLAHEFWYYIAFPFFALGLFRRRGWVRSVFMVLAGTLILGVITRFNTWHAPVILYFLLWVLGTVAAAAPRPLIASARLSAALFVATTVFLRIVPVIFHYPPNASHFEHGANYFFPFDLLVAASFANMLATFKHSTHLAAPPGRQLNCHFAAFSFSLYCVHFPILYLVASIAVRFFGVGYHYDGSAPVGMALIASGVLASVVAAFLFSRLTEAHTDTIRKAIFAFLERPHHF